MLSARLAIASSCPNTVLFRVFSRLRSPVFSLVPSFSTGIPIMRDTVFLMAAVSSFKGSSASFPSPVFLSLASAAHSSMMSNALSGRRRPVI